MERIVFEKHLQYLMKIYTFVHVHTKCKYEIGLNKSRVRGLTYHFKYARMCPRFKGECLNILNIERGSLVRRNLLLLRVVQQV